MQCPACGKEATGDVCASCQAWLTTETPKWYSEGVAHLTAERQFKMAHTLLTEGLQRYPTSAMLWYNAGVLAELVRKPDAAVNCYQEAIRLRPIARYQQALNRVTGKPVVATKMSGVLPVEPLANPAIKTSNNAEFAVLEAELNAIASELSAYVDTHAVTEPPSTPAVPPTPAGLGDLPNSTESPPAIAQDLPASASDADDMYQFILSTSAPEPTQLALPPANEPEAPPSATPAVTPSAAVESDGASLVFSPLEDILTLPSGSGTIQPVVNEPLEASEPLALSMPESAAATPTADDDPFVWQPVIPTEETPVAPLELSIVPPAAGASESEEPPANWDWLTTLEASTGTAVTPTDATLISIPTEEPATLLQPAQVEEESESAPEAADWSWLAALEETSGVTPQSPAATSAAPHMQVEPLTVNPVPGIPASPTTAPAENATDMHAFILDGIPTASMPDDTPSTTKEPLSWTIDIPTEPAAASAATPEAAEVFTFSLSGAEAPTVEELAPTTAPEAEAFTFIPLIEEGATPEVTTSEQDSAAVFTSLPVADSPAETIPDIDAETLSLHADEPEAELFTITPMGEAVAPIPEVTEPDGEVFSFTPLAVDTPEPAATPAAEAFSFTPINEDPPATIEPEATENIFGVPAAEAAAVVPEPLILPEEEACPPVIEPETDTVTIMPPGETIAARPAADESEAEYALPPDEETYRFTLASEPTEEERNEPTGVDTEPLEVKAWPLDTEPDPVPEPAPDAETTLPVTEPAIVEAAAMPEGAGVPAETPAIPMKVGEIPEAAIEPVSVESVAAPEPDTLHTRESQEIAEAVTLAPIPETLETAALPVVPPPVDPLAAHHRWRTITLICRILAGLAVLVFPFAKNASVVITSLAVFAVLVITSFLTDAKARSLSAALSHRTPMMKH